MAKRVGTMVREYCGLPPKKQSKTIRYEMYQKMNNEFYEREKAQRAERIEAK